MENSIPKAVGYAELRSDAAAMSRIIFSSQLLGHFFYLERPVACDGLQ